MSSEIDYASLERWMSALMAPPGGRVIPVRACSDVGSGVVILFVTSPSRPIGFLGQACYAAVTLEGRDFHFDDLEPAR